MSQREHRYEVTVVWTGNAGQGTSDYRSYARNHEIRSGDAPAISGSSDPSFRGDPSRWNPEQLLVASLSACHKLWYLHLCAEAGVVVTAYQDRAVGLMREHPDGGGDFVEVVLRPEVDVTADSDTALAQKLHAEAARLCFIARSVKFPVRHEPTVRTAVPVE